MYKVKIIVELSDLYEAVGAEGGFVAKLIDQEILPYLREDNENIGIGDRFNQVIDKVKASANRTGKDAVRTLKDMMKSALITYSNNTKDIMTVRKIYRAAIMAGSNMMLTVTAAVILANALHGQNSAEAKSLVHQVAARLSGEQTMEENASSSATSSSSISSSKKKKKPRTDSIFCELSWQDVQNIPNMIENFKKIVESGYSHDIDGIMIDPTTAELVATVYKSLPIDKRLQYESKSINEMIEIAYRCVQRGIIQVVMKEA